MPSLPTTSARPVAYSYIRFSANKQFKGDSLRRQLERSRDYANKLGLTLDESTTIRDLGVSAFRGANRQIGGLGGFLKAVETGKIAPGSFLLVESFDRLSRENPVKAIEPFIGLINAGIIVVTLIDEVVHSQERYSTEWSGLIVSLAKMAQANEESVKKSDRLSEIWKVKHARTAAGVIATSKCPGWLKKENGNFVLISERVAIVRRIFEEFLSGKGRGTIALLLNRDGVPPFGHGRAWHGGTIQKITTNPAVIGHYTPHTVKREVVAGPDSKPMMREKRIIAGTTNTSYYPAIISEEMFHRAQLVAKNRSVTPGNTGGRKGTIYSNLFSGIAKCSECRSPMNYVDRGVRSSVVLRCSGERQGVCRNDQRYPYKALENAALRWIQELDLGETTSREIAEIDSRIAKSNIERDRYMKAANELMDEFEGTIGAVKDRIIQHQKEIDKIDAEISAENSRLNGLKSAIPGSVRKAQVAKLWARMAVAEGSELYAIRAALAQSLRDIVKVMIFQHFGRVHCVIHKAEKHYIFNPATDQPKLRYTVEPIRLNFVHDEDMPLEQIHRVEVALQIKNQLEAAENSVLPAEDAVVLKGSGPR